MSRWDAETARATPLPTVLFVGCSRHFVSRCQAFVRRNGAVSRDTPVSSCTTQAARFRPLVIVLLNDVYEFDRVSFEALAQDVGAELLPLSTENIAQNDLEALLGLALLTANRKRPAGAAG